MQHAKGVHRRFFGLAVAISAATMVLAQTGIPASAGVLRGSYRQTNLVSDLPDVHAMFQDPQLVNPWGLASSPTSPIWVSDNNAGVTTLYKGDGTEISLTSTGGVEIPAPGGGPGGTPTGDVFNSTTSDFMVSMNGKTGKAAFIFATEDGTIAGWSPAVNVNSAVIAVDNSQAGAPTGAVYKGLTLGSVVESDGSTANFLYATNFRAGTVDVFDKIFNQVTIPGGFTDPGIPSGFAPFGIQNIGGQIFVTYAMQDALKHDDVAGPGNGFVDIFNTRGTFVRRLATRGTLNSPWGLAMSPSTFGNFHNDVLVGDFGDGLINAFTTTGVFRGQLKSETNAPIHNDGLWGLRFGNGGNGGDLGTLFFSAGLDGESHGLFGTIQAVEG